MILPHTNTSLIILMCLCMLCWGSWPALYKLAKKCRFELFYFDFGFGLGLIALLSVFTLGSLGFDGFNFSDDLLNARRQEWLIAILAAMIFNFGNMMMLAAISVAGMAVAFPLTVGVGMIVSSWMGYFGGTAANTIMLMAGTLLLLLSALVGSLGYTHLRTLQYETLARAGKTKSTRRPGSLKGIVLALVGGVVIGAFNPLFLRAQDPEDGVGPYSLLFLFSFGVVASTFVFNLFFMNLPVQGDPLELTDYFKMPLKHHAFGILSGALWGIGALAGFVAATPKGDTHPHDIVAMLGHAAPLIAAMWGWLVWKEFKAGDVRVKAFAGLMLLLFAGGFLFFSYAAPVR